ncbi:TVP38/TMEM64 family protein [Leucobacter sp. USHLN153]|uniref:TVP38/TMEM64 family protein n=1 Tax=Leucobacter sp. USHLN153 TaxID=3081268 RepID=UPI003019117F
MSETSQRTRLWPLVGVALLCAAVIAALLFFGRPLLPLFSDPETARETIDGLGFWAPFAFLLMQIVQVVIAPLPGQVSGLIGGFLFGPWFGLLYTVVGSFIGFWIVFVAARKLGRPFVERFVRPETLEKFDRLLTRQGPFVLFLIYLLPAFPDDVISVVAGLTRIPIRTLLLVSVAGRLPGYLVLSFAGDGLTGENMNPMVVGGTVVLAAAILAVWKRKWIHDFVAAEQRAAFLRTSWSLPARHSAWVILGLVALSAFLFWAAFVPPVQ